MKDKYGFDPEETTKIEDNPFWDCTDFSHPAWWRGEEYSYKMICKKINEWLDGKNLDGTASPELEKIKQRIILLKNV